jgi:hypothetical protein
MLERGQFWAGAREMQLTIGLRKLDPGPGCHAAIGFLEYFRPFRDTYKDLVRSEDTRFGGGLNYRGLHRGSERNRSDPGSSSAAVVPCALLSHTDG